MSDKMILLTGISGFIAKHCAVELLRAGYRVRGTVRSLGKADAVRSTLAYNSCCRKSLGMAFIPVCETAPAMARSQVETGVV